MFGERILGVALNSKVLWRNCTMKTLPVEIYSNVQTFAPPQYNYNSHIAVNTHCNYSIKGRFVHIHLNRVRHKKSSPYQNEFWIRVEVESKTPPYLEAFTSRSSC